LKPFSIWRDYDKKNPAGAVVANRSLDGAKETDTSAINAGTAGFFFKGIIRLLAEPTGLSGSANGLWTDGFTGLLPLR
jgi:hypothetical protein